MTTSRTSRSTDTNALARDRLPGDLGAGDPGDPAGLGDLGVEQLRARAAEHPKMSAGVGPESPKRTILFPISRIFVAVSLREAASPSVKTRFTMSKPPAVPVASESPAARQPASSWESSSFFRRKSFPSSPSFSTTRGISRQSVVNAAAIEERILCFAA